jgi:hypothetical protein
MRKSWIKTWENNIIVPKVICEKKRGVDKQRLHEIRHSAATVRL